MWAVWSEREPTGELKRAYDAWLSLIEAEWGQWARWDEERRRARDVLVLQRRRDPSARETSCPECMEALDREWCAGCGWNAAETEVSPGEWAEILSDLNEQKKLNPDQARQVLHVFCESVERCKQIPPEVLHYIAGAFRRSLGGEDLSGALFLNRGPGAPNALARHQKMAMRILNDRLSGLRYAEAIKAATDPCRGETVPKDAWKNYGLDALLELRTRRAAAAIEWTPKELDRLKKIFPRKSILEHCPNCNTINFVGVLRCGACRRPTTPESPTDP